MTLGIYNLFEILGVVLGLLAARCLSIPKAENKNGLSVYICLLLGLIIGMKLPVIISYGFEGNLGFTGKSFMGGVLGAFTAINLYKIFTHQNQSSFGGRFVIPLAIAAGIGKIGCYFNGCCASCCGIPVQLIESVFQIIAAFSLFLFYRRTKRADLLFPIYLLSYLIMRFLVEFIRTEPRVIGPYTIYHILAVIYIPIVFLVLRRRRRDGVCQ